MSEAHHGVHCIGDRLVCELQTSRTKDGTIDPESVVPLPACPSPPSRGAGRSHTANGTLRKRERDGWDHVARIKESKFPI